MEFLKSIQISKNSQIKGNKEKKRDKEKNNKITDKSPTESIIRLNINKLVPQLKRQRYSENINKQDPMICFLKEMP